MQHPVGHVGAERDQRVHVGVGVARRRQRLPVEAASGEGHHAEREQQQPERQRPGVDAATIAAITLGNGLRFLGIA